MPLCNTAENGNNCINANVNRGSASGRGGSEESLNDWIKDEERDTWINRLGGMLGKDSGKNG